MKKLTPTAAIKMFCRVCQGLGPKDRLEPVRDCKSVWGKSADEIDASAFPDGCPLWPYRMGTNPGRKREWTEEQRQAARERMTKMHEERAAPGHGDGGEFPNA